MNLYLLEQNEETGYDTYDALVVAAETPEEAAKIHPHRKWPKVKERYGVWCSTPEEVTVTLLGVVNNPDIKEGVILSSFNAG